MIFRSLLLLNSFRTEVLAQNPSELEGVPPPVRRQHRPQSRGGGSAGVGRERGTRSPALGEVFFCD